jgi:hypothetical protein
MKTVFRKLKNLGELPRSFPPGVARMLRECPETYRCR